MKKVIITCMVLAAVLFSCKESDASGAKTKPELTNECYEGSLGKDVFKAKLDILGSEVRTGTLTYNFFEKDKNEGHVSGIIKGDTIFLTYKFASEGIMSSREVAFLKKGDTLIEGFGDIATDSVGKVTFKDRSKLSFNSNIKLEKKNCR